ncbi:RlpA-like protein precursor [compost metagenome]
MKFGGALLATALATFLTAATALPSYGLDIYEPDSRFDAAPNTAQTAAMFQSAETTAQVVPGGAELVSSNPQYANAVVSVDKDGKVRGDVYVRLQRVISLVGDDGSRANAIAASLNKAYASGNLRADKITPGRRDRQYAIMAGRQPLIVVDDKLAASQGARPATLVLKWMDNLRTAMGGVPFATTASRHGSLISGSAVGHASWYGPGFHGRRTANGERFDQWAMTAAHKTLPLGSLLLVTNLKNKRTILVRVNDRGPYIPGRMLDLSAGAAQAIGVSGVGTVRIDVLKQ